MLRVTHQGTFHMGVKEKGPVSAHILLYLACGLWAVASGGKAAILVWREGGALRAAPHQAFGSPEWW